jgi:transketolase
MLKKPKILDTEIKIETKKELDEIRVSNSTKKKVIREAKDFKIITKEKEIDYKQFLKENKFDGIIKIQKNDYKLIHKNQKLLTHFNLQYSGHEKGKVYLLVKILKQGHYISDEDFSYPVLDLNNCYVAKCLEVRNYIDCNTLQKEDFENSFENIKNKTELKKQILERYSHSLPEFSNKEILDLGVSITQLEIIDKFTFEELKRKISESYISTLDDNSKGQTRNGFGKAMVELAKQNKNIVGLCADLKDSLKLGEFAKQNPNNFYEFGISEQNMLSAAAGMTINNKIPFVASYAAFNPGRNWDQLRVSVCYSNTNVKIVGGHAGLTTGPDGATHQALEDIAITRTLPNLVVIVPCDENQTKQATIASAKYKGPVYIRLSRENGMNITNTKTEFEIGKSQVLDKGEDLTIIATGLTVQFALKAREELKLLNISASVINLHTIKPLDEKTILEYARKTKAIITIEEHQIQGGMGSAVSEYLSQNYSVPIEMIGVQNTFGESGNGYELLEKYNISTKEIIQRAKKILKRK